MKQNKGTAALENLFPEPDREQRPLFIFYVFGIWYKVLHILYIYRYEAKQRESRTRKVCFRNPIGSNAPYWFLMFLESHIKYCTFCTFGLKLRFLARLIRNWPIFTLPKSGFIRQAVVSMELAGIAIASLNETHGFQFAKSDFYSCCGLASIISSFFLF